MEQTTNTTNELQKLVLETTAYDMNNQLEQLIFKFKDTGDENYLKDSEALRSEFYSWWDETKLAFVTPVES